MIQESDYKELLSKNPTCALTGSLSLIAQGFKIKREPGDTDLYDPDQKFKIIEGMSKPKTDPAAEKEKYADSLQPDWTRDRYLLGTIKVDVFSSTADKMKIIKVKGGELRSLS